MSELTITYHDPRNLKPNPRNPRKHSKKQIQQLVRSIKTFGFLNAVLIDDAKVTLAGHCRIEAAIQAGLETIPTVTIDHLGEVEARAYLIADNKLAANSEWDPELLAQELKELHYNLHFDATKAGFEVPEIDLLCIVGQAASDNPDGIPEADTSAPAVSRLGDLWRIGEHLVLCGDSTLRSSFERLMGNEQARMVFTDAPYNVKVSGHVSGLGKHQHREFAMASGEMSEEAFTDFLRTVLKHLADFSLDGALHYLCMDWRHMWEIMSAAKGTYVELKNLCVWAKTNGGMGSLYRSQHELVFVYKSGTASHINNVELGKHGRNRTNLWPYAGANAFGASRDADLAMHPTVKPVQLVADAILDASNPGDVVLDAFGGSGSTLAAAAQTGRRGRAIEIDPHYVDTIVRRLERQLKVDATLVGDGDTFKAVAAWRASGLA